MMGKKPIFFVITLLLFVPLLGFAVPQLAVLEAILAAGIDPTVAPLITSKIEEEFVNSGKYRVLDRANIDHVLGEKEFQLSSGIVRNEEVRQAGEYLGADFVVVANVSRVGQTFVVAAKMIDVVSGQIAAQTSHDQQGRIDVLLEIARVVGAQLAGTEVDVAEEPVVVEVEKPKVEEEPAKEEELKVTEVKPVAKPPKVRKPVEFKRFVVGAKVGGNLAKALTDTWFDWYHRDYDGNSLHFSNEWPYSVFGLNGGVFVTLNLNNYLGVQVEALYSQKGYKYDFEDWDTFATLLGPVTNVFRFHYVELPLLFKASLPGRYSPYAVLGPAVDMLLAATVENVYENPGIQTTFDSLRDNPLDIIDDPVSDFNRIDIGLVAGAGIDILLGSLLVNLEVRYTLGLMPASANADYKNGAFSFSGGVGFQL